MVKKKLKKDNLYSVITTTGFVLIISIVILGCSWIVRDTAEADCYETIEDTAAQAVGILQQNISADQKQLDIISNGLFTYTDLKEGELKNLLEHYSQVEDFDTIAVRLANGELIYGGESIPNITALPSFEAETKRGQYLSDVFVSGAENNYFYYAQPIENSDGVADAILYGFVNLNTLPKWFDLTVYNGQAEFYLVDGNSGDFMMDTWHNALGNIYDGDVGDREMKPGFSISEMYKGIKNGESGYFVFAPKTVGRYFYTYYMPAGVNNWSLQVTIDENIAFADHHKITRIITHLLSAVIVLTLAYMFSTIYRYRRNLILSKKENARRKFAFDIEHALFNAHQSSVSVTTALETVCDNLQAERVSLFYYKDNTIRSSYVYRKDGGDWEGMARNRNIVYDFPSIYNRIMQNEDVSDENNIVFISLDKTKSFLTDAEYDILEVAGIKNMLVVPVVEASNILRCAMCIVNYKESLQDTSTLIRIANTFYMALKAVESHNLLLDMGMIDRLTGIKSRNCYEEDVQAYKEAVCDNMHCVFIDANGLHEINNRFGHKAGDKILITIANMVVEIFGQSSSYRIGGDEFVVFKANAAEAEMREKVQRLQANLAECECYISVGMATEDGAALDVDALIAEAERNMYQDKEAFYKSNECLGDVRMSGRMNVAALSDYDADFFTSLIPACFLGIHIVNVKTDEHTMLCKPKYFSDILEANHNRYQVSMREYGKKYVSDQDIEKFNRTTSYDYVLGEMIAGRPIKMDFIKKNGVQILLRIFPARDFTEEKPETMWMFEQITNEQ